jgi:hypothetical protein
MCAIATTLHVCSSWSSLTLHIFVISSKTTESITNRLISMVYYLYQLTHHWNLQFREKYFLKFQPIKTKKCRWRPCFLPDQNEIKKFCRRPRKHNFCKVLIEEINRFVCIRQKTWPSWTILVSDWWKFKNDLQLTFSTRSVYKFPNLILILHKNGHWQYLFLICWNLKIISNDLLQMMYRVCNVLYKDSLFINFIP